MQLLRTGRHVTKSISIEADGVIADVLVAGTNGITVSAASTDVVVIRGLTIEGIGTGLTGIAFNSGGALHVENCEINGFIQRGIDFFPTGTGTSQLFVKDTKIHGNGGGTWVQPGAGITANASVDHVRVERNLFGIKAEQGSHVVIRDSVAASNTNSGFIANSGGGAVDLTIENSVSTGNGLNGILSMNPSATTDGAPTSTIGQQ